MYVQIEKTVRDSLQKNVIAEMMMGSHAHGLADEKSDKDILYIYYDKDYGNNIYWESNGWQYKTDGIDENYQEIRVFIRNLITAKMCGNLEALLGGWVLNENLSKANALSLDVLFKLLMSLKSYAIIKSYMGYAKKDMKNAEVILNQAGDKAFESRDFRKKITHIIRGLNTIVFLLEEGTYDFFEGSESEDYEMAKEIKSGNLQYCCGWLTSFIEVSNSSLTEYREQLNNKLNSKTISRRGDSHILNRINGLLNYLVSKIEGTTIDYNDDLRLDIIEKGENHQYI